MELHQHKPLAVVTGASSGIGYELAREFSEHGFDLVIAAEDAGIIEARQAFDKGNSFVKAVRVDLSTFDGVEKLTAAIHELNRPVDALAINAGVGISGEFIETDLEAEVKLIHLNVVSAVHLAKRLVPAMKQRGEGRVLFTSSVAATSPGPYYAVYAASKAFLQSFAEALRYELKDTGVSVTSLMPGATDTHFFERAGMQDTKAATGKKDDPRDVAHDGFEALMAGKDHVYAGSLKNAVAGVMGRILPESMGAGLQASATKPGSGVHP